MTRAFSTENIVSAIISAVVGTILTLILQPIVAKAQAPIKLTSPDSSVVMGTAPLPPERIPSQLVPVAPPPSPSPSPSPSPPAPRIGKFGHGPDHDLYGFRDQDKNGSLAFEAFVLTQNFRWKYASNDQVIHPSSEVVQDVPAYFKNHLSHLLTDAEDIISIGMASCEGDRPGEERRAGLRAEQLNIWVQQARPDNNPRNYHIVNLGQYKNHDCRAMNPPGEDETSDQRRIVVLYVTQKVNVHGKEDLANRILRQLKVHDDLLFDPTDYSKDFALKGTRFKS